MKKLFGFLTLALLIAMVVTGCANGTTSGTTAATGTSGNTATVTNPTGTTGGTTGGTSSGGASGTLIVNATDAPPSHNVTSVIVTVASVKVHIAGAGENTTIPTSDNESTPTMTSVNTTGSGSGAGGQWIDIPLNTDNATFDLLQIQGILHSFGSANLTPGTYTQIRIEISSIKVGLNGGAPQEAKLPSGVLKVVRPFQVASNMATSLNLDFQADRMVTVTGNNEIIVKPVVKLSISKPSPANHPGPSNGPGPSGPTHPNSSNSTPPKTGQTMIPTTLPTQANH